MDITEVKRIWSEVKAILRETIPAHAYYSWVEAMEAVGFDNDVFNILTVHQMATQIVRQSYSSQINDALEKVLGRHVDFTISYDADLAEKYKKEVRSLDKKIDTASLKWFVQAGAITDKEIDLYHLCRKRRNDITHELLKNLCSGFHENDVELFSSMVHLYQKLDNWWINEIEIPTSADEIPEDYDRNQVVGGQAIILSVVNDIILGNGATKYNEILELLRKMQKEKNYGQECN